MSGRGICLTCRAEVIIPGSTNNYHPWLRERPKARRDVPCMDDPLPIPERIKEMVQTNREWRSWLVAAFGALKHLPPSPVRQQLRRQFCDALAKYGPGSDIVACLVLALVPVEERERAVHVSLEVVAR